MRGPSAASSSAASAPEPAPNSQTSSLPDGVQRLVHLAGQRPGEQRRQLGRGDEVAAAFGHAADDEPAARVVAEPRLVEGHRHEGAERQPAAGRVDGRTDPRHQGRRYTLCVIPGVHRAL